MAPANIRGRLTTVQPVMISGLTLAFVVNYFLAQAPAARSAALATRARSARDPKYSADHRPSFRDVAAPGTGFRPIVWAGIMLATFQHSSASTSSSTADAVEARQRVRTRAPAQHRLQRGLDRRRAPRADPDRQDRPKPLLLIGSVGMAVTLGAMTWAFNNGGLDEAGNLMLDPTPG